MAAGPCDKPCDVAAGPCDKPCDVAAGPCDKPCDVATGPCDKPYTQSALVVSLIHVIVIFPTNRGTRKLE